jgi:Glycosyltransferase family 10 (fucosyltransferase) C-term
MRDLGTCRVARVTLTNVMSVRDPLSSKWVTHSHSMTVARTAKFVTTSAAWPWKRQTPKGDGIFGNTRFIFDGEEAPYDFLLVYDGLPNGFAERIRPESAIFAAGEPATVKRYSRRFLAQFGTILTSDRSTPHANRIVTQTGLPWHIGVPTAKVARYHESLDFAALARLSGEKTKLISVICSNKTMTPAQQLRIPFARALKDHFGERLDFFGRGFRDIDDKAEALVPYRYHVVLENSDDRDYWSEKIADPFLAETFPFYWGCRNLEDYFPKDSFVRIDLTNAAAAIATIEAAIASDRATQARAAVSEAKRRVLTEHNVFAVLDRVLDGLPASERGPKRRPVKIMPEKYLPEGYLRLWLVRLAEWGPALHRLRRRLYRLVLGKKN